ncbi:hypothetical protein Plhal304r1_c057g0143261 [Plasmopara halstedii]
MIVLSKFECEKSSARRVVRNSIHRKDKLPENEAITQLNHERSETPFLLQCHDGYQKYKYPR